MSKYKFKLKTKDHWEIGDVFVFENTFYEATLTYLSEHPLKTDIQDNTVDFSKLLIQTKPQNDLPKIIVGRYPDMTISLSETACEIRDESSYKKLLAKIRIAFFSMTHLQDAINKFLELKI